TYLSCFHNSFLAHGAVVQMARQMANSANWKFSLPSITDWIYPEPANPPTYDSSTLLEAQWFFDPCFYGDYGAELKAMYPTLPTFTAEQKVMMKGSCDYIAVNIYSSQIMNATTGAAEPAVPLAEMSEYTNQEINDPAALKYWPHPIPAGFRALPNWLYRRYNKEVVITEIGYHVPRFNESTFEQAVNDDLRVQFWQLVIPELVNLVQEDKVPLSAVLAWSLLDNYEWQTYEFRWGHIAVDYWDPLTGKVNTDKGSLKRQPKNSLKFMSGWFSTNTVSPFNTTGRFKNSTTPGTLGVAVTAITMTTTKSEVDKGVIAGAFWMSLVLIFIL
ncbi:hypothetical protein HDU98_010850, partial [Podochytrium sp. JEL0797]